jgi:hypothetical protein
MVQPVTSSIRRKGSRCGRTDSIASFRRGTSAMRVESIGAVLQLFSRAGRERPAQSGVARGVPGNHANSRRLTAHGCARRPLTPRRSARSSITKVSIDGR